MAKRDNTESLGTLLHRWLAPLHRDPAFRNAAARAAWEELLGSSVAQRTQRLEWHGAELVVWLDSSAMRHELDLQKNRIAEAMRLALGEEYPLDKLRFS